MAFRPVYGRRLPGYGLPACITPKIACLWPSGLYYTKDGLFMAFRPVLCI